MVDDAKIEPRALVGKWHFERDIVDRLSGSTKHVFGETTISDAGDGRMRWYESGTLRDGDLELPVFRTLFVAERGLEWAVTFEDGREFHDWRRGRKSSTCAVRIPTAGESTSLPEIDRPGLSSGP